MWGLAIALVVIWVLVELVFGIAGALFHLLLVAAVVVIVYNPIRAGASRRTWAGRPPGSAGGRRPDRLVPVRVNSGAA